MIEGRNVLGISKEQKDSVCKIHLNKKWAPLTLFI
jgi:hypothetical protein